MKQIYDFEQYNPPIINENILNARLEQKRTARNAILTGIAVLVMQLLVLTMGYLLYEKYPLLTLLCVAYVIFSVISGSVISIIYSKKGVYIQ